MFKKITIVGLGLMGGSLAAACRKRFPGAHVVGVTRNRQARALALRKKWVHEATDDILKGARDADLAILCTPVDTYLPMLKKLDRVAKNGALVMDVGSVKVSVHKVADRKWRRISFVGAHPMVGSHARGIDAACPCLYEQGTVILTRTGKTCQSSYQKARKFWGRLAKKIIHLTPETHDRLVSEISHLPHALAVCLVRAASQKSLCLAATGFRDTTRIAASAPSVWIPIFGANKKNTLAGITRFEKELKRFKKILRGGNPKALARYLEGARKIRRSI